MSTIQNREDKDTQKTPKNNNKKPNQTKHQKKPPTFSLSSFHFRCFMEDISRSFTKEISKKSHLFFVLGSKDTYKSIGKTLC